ncbi:hypothetical protein [Thalassospira profundimaris]|uniref:Uncharacterized protein n=1 Tax=Thalassospira profundimaris TaxID=502049 RepID=A0A367WP03_9PROT|nr:hypothetical protein [Thalassospira profundimaris]RCK43206.1 hypothetical protein TH30_19505 [Thalassospira profundimaris]
MTNLQSNPRQKAQEILFAWFAFQRSLGSRIKIAVDAIEPQANTDLIIRLLADMAAQLDNLPEIISGKLPFQDETAGGAALSSVLREECKGIHNRIQSLDVPARWVDPLDRDNTWPLWKKFCDLVADYIDAKRVYGQFISNEQDASKWRELLLRLVDPSLGTIIGPSRLKHWLGVKHIQIKLPDISTNPPKGRGPFTIDETDHEFLKRKARQQVVDNGDVYKLERSKP